MRKRSFRRRELVATALTLWGVRCGGNCDRGKNIFSLIEVPVVVGNWELFRNAWYHRLILHIAFNFLMTEEIVHWENGNSKHLCSDGLNFKVLNTRIHGADVQSKLLLHKGIHLICPILEFFQGITGWIVSSACPTVACTLDISQFISNSNRDQFFYLFNTWPPFCWRRGMFQLLTVSFQ